MRSEQAITKTFQARFGSVVRSQRQGAGLSQEELAHRSGLHRTYVTDVERGARNPSLNSIKKLSDALGVPLSDLFALVEGKQIDAGADGGIRGGNPRNDFSVIVVAEDKQTGLESALRSMGEGLTESVRFFHDGVETLDYIFCTGPYKKRDVLGMPNLLLLDLSLADVNGVEVLRRLRANPLTSALPVIVLATSSEEALAHAKELGVTDVVTAPVDPPKIARSLSRAGFRLSFVPIRK